MQLKLHNRYVESTFKPNTICKYSLKEANISMIFRCNIVAVTLAALVLFLISYVKSVCIYHIKTVSSTSPTNSTLNFHLRLHVLCIVTKEYMPFCISICLRWFRTPTVLPRKISFRMCSIILYKNYSLSGLLS